MNTDYRTYKNGIYRLKYRKLYIIPTEDDKCQVINDKVYLVIDNMDSREDAIWEIEKRCASEEELKLLKFLYSKSISELTTYMLDYFEKKDKQSKYIYNMCNIIRDRKNNNKEW